MSSAGHTEKDEKVATDIYAQAPDGAIYVCGACGKTSPTEAPSKGSDRGWDESCMLNSVLCDAASLVRDSSGRVVSADAYKTTGQAPSTDTTVKS